MIYSLLLLSKTNSLKIPIKNQDNYQYTISSFFGTPGQELDILISTGSKYSWVTSDDCASCPSSKSFDSLSSTTFQVTSWKPESFSFMNGVVSGTPSSDIIYLDDDLEARFPFILASIFVEYDKNLVYKPAGSLGLCPYSGFMQTLIESGLIKETIFSIYLSNNGFSDREVEPESQILFGEVDLELTRKGESVRIETEGCWEFSLSKMEINGIAFEFESKGFFDSSSYYIFGPKDQVSKILTVFIQNYHCSVSIEGFYVCSCLKSIVYANIKFVVNGKVLELTPEQYFYKIREKCYLLFMYSKKPNYQFWVFGLPFFREYYGVFNVSDLSILFYPSKPSTILSDDITSIERWVTITIVITVIILSFISLFTIYSILCKSPSRWVSV